MVWTVRALLAGAMLLCVLGSSAIAQEKSAVRGGFVLPAGSVRILLFRPAITVGAQSTGGMFEPNADWTQQARDSIGAGGRSTAGWATAS